MVENHKRAYRRPEEWTATYAVAHDKGIALTHRWYVENHYCKSEAAARKMSSRHRKAGILAAEGMKCPESFRPVKNVTAAIGSRPPTATQSGGTNQILLLKAELSTKSIEIRQSPHSSAQALEQSVCNAKSDIPSSTIRSRRFRAKQRALARCSCSPATGICDHCYNTKFLPVTAFDTLHASHVHSALKRSPDRRFWAARDSLHLQTFQIHRTFFEFCSPYFDKAEFENAPHHNKAILGDFTANGIPCSFKAYKGGLVIIYPRYSRTPKLPSELHPFMLDVQAAFPYYSPPVDTWRIATTDLHLDAPTTEPGRRHIKFRRKGVKFQCYNKDLPGKRRILRLEAQVPIGCTIAQYPAATEAIQKKLLNVLGWD